MKHLFWIGAVALMLPFIGCDDFDWLDPDDRDEIEHCDFVYPVSFTLPDSSVVTAHSHVELDSLAQLWDSLQIIPVLNFPIQFMTADSMLLTINDEDDLEEAWDECEEDDDDDGDDDDGDDDDDECFELVYPVTYTMPDSSQITANSEAEADSAFTVWYGNNPGIDDEPTLNYPVDVILEDGTQRSVANEDELDDLEDDCDD